MDIHFGPAVTQVRVVRKDGAGAGLVADRRVPGSRSRGTITAAGLALAEGLARPAGPIGARRGGGGPGTLVQRGSDGAPA
jgi:hypothetical protein